MSSGAWRWGTYFSKKVLLKLTVGRSCCGKSIPEEGAAGEKATVPGAKCCRGEWNGRGMASRGRHVGSWEHWLISNTVGSHRRVFKLEDIFTEGLLQARLGAVESTDGKW